IHAPVELKRCLLAHRQPQKRHYPTLILCHKYLAVLTESREDCLVVVVAMECKSSTVCSFFINSQAGCDIGTACGAANHNTRFFRLTDVLTGFLRHMA